MISIISLIITFIFLFKLNLAGIFEGITLRKYFTNLYLSSLFSNITLLAFSYKDFQMYFVPIVSSFFKSWFCLGSDTLSSVNKRVLFISKSLNIPLSLLMEELPVIIGLVCISLLETF